MADLKGKVIFITGASRGIGKAIALRAAADGACIAVAAKTTEPHPRLDGTIYTACEEIEAAGGKALPCVVDVRDEAQVDGFFDQVGERFGAPTVAIANAGIYPNTPVVEMPVEEWDRVMETNARGAFLTGRAAARAMIAAGNGGNIITISSGAYRSGRVGAAHYCASKAAVVMLTQVMALELAPHRIRVNCIAPGLIEVEGEVSPISEEYKTTLANSIPWGRIGQPEDIANAALFLSSPEADFITGEVLSVNGGSSAGRAFLPPSNP